MKRTTFKQFDWFRLATAAGALLGMCFILAAPTVAAPEGDVGATGGEGGQQANHGESE